MDICVEQSALAVALLVIELTLLCAERICLFSEVATIFSVHRKSAFLLKLKGSVVLKYT